MLIWLPVRENMETGLVPATWKAMPEHPSQAVRRIMSMVQIADAVALLTLASPPLGMELDSDM